MLAFERTLNSISYRIVLYRIVTKACFMLLRRAHRRDWISDGAEEDDIGGQLCADDGAV